MAQKEAKRLAERAGKISLGEMCEMGVRGLLVYCPDYRCSHSIAISADRWSDQVRLSDLEELFVCQACGIKGADLRPDYNWRKTRKSPVQNGGDDRTGLLGGTHP